MPTTRQGSRTYFPTKGGEQQGLPSGPPRIIHTDVLSSCFIFPANGKIHEMIGKESGGLFPTHQDPPTVLGSTELYVHTLYVLRCSCFSLLVFLDYIFPDLLGCPA